MVEPDLARWPSAGDAGRLCAVAAEAQRDLQRCAATYRTLFPEASFDPGLYSAVACANMFSAPWLSATRARATNRASLWAFGVDRLVDTVCTSAQDVAWVRQRCEQVGDGAPPAAGDELAALLYDIRTELVGAAAYPTLGARWRGELTRMLAAMAREWQWAHGERRPSVEEYLDNSDNLGFGFVFATFLVSTADPQLAPGAVEALFRAGSAVQQVIRLANDLASIDSDVASGDLNVLLLGVDPSWVGGTVERLTAHSRELLRPLRGPHPYDSAYLERELDYNLGFYAVGDYWMHS